MKTKDSTHKITLDRLPDNPSPPPVPRTLNRGAIRMCNKFLKNGIRIKPKNANKIGEKIMSSSASKSGDKWSNTDKEKLKSMIRGKRTTKSMASALKRSPAAIRSMASRIGESVKPKDR